MAERGAWKADWIPIAQKFPATLAKDSSPEALNDGESPDAYGLGIERDGYLYAASSAPDGSTWNGSGYASAPTNSPLSGFTEQWIFALNRLWGWTPDVDAAKLYYSAFGYDSNYLLAGLGYIPCDYEQSYIKRAVPFGDNIAVFKNDCLYVVGNSSNPGSFLISSYFGQSAGLPAVGNVMVMRDILYWANTYGIWAFNGQQINELTQPIRNNLGTFESGSIDSFNSDFAKNDLIGRSGSTTKFVVRMGERPMLFDYSTSGFRFTTRTIVGADGEPLLIDKIALVYQYSSDKAYFKFQVKINDTWKDEQTYQISPENDNGRCEIQLDNFLACRKFALRVTDMTDGLYVARIMVHVKQGGVLGYSNK